MKTQLATLSFIATFPFLFSPTASAENGRICFENRVTFPGAPVVRGEYWVDFNKGEVVSLVGQDCVTLAGEEEECFPAAATAEFANGKLEMAGRGSNNLSVPGGGTVFTFSETYIELDPSTLKGTGVTILKTVIDGVISEQVLDASVEAVGCPKLTNEERSNSDQLKEMLKRLDRL